MNRHAETASLLGDPKRGRHAKESRAWQGSLSDRVRVTRKLPQAILKISSHNSGQGRVRARLRYISRQGALAIETDEGISVEGIEGVDRLVDDWAADFSTRVNSRDTMSLVISMPAGTDEKVAVAAARAFFAETFAENHEYAFAAHDDTDNFHIHLVVKARGRDGKPMRASRRDPQLWRQAFAEKARENGIELDASPRYARGIGRRTPPTSVFEIRRRDEMPTVDKQAAKEALRRARNAKDRPSKSETVIRQINVRERLMYAKQASVVVKEAKSIKDDKRRLAALEIASELASFAEGMPVPQSRMDTMKFALKPKLGRASVEMGEVRKLVKRTERGIRDQVGGFASTKDQRTAIAARVRLSNVVSERNRSRDRDIER
ncbi:MAG: hypothetical protein DRR42_07510 [Gammaproteobacteria bacterium]|nr:MAG: hypothetical protein DRR42_07510 [Gammaproteobacteria bacterium]